MGGQLLASSSVSRSLVRKTAEFDTEQWITDNLPQGHTLPRPAILAAQAIGLRDALRSAFRAQEERLAEYVSENPPALAPIDGGALVSLPIEAALTYHSWLEDVALHRAEEAKRELAGILAEHLREATGTGGMAALVPAGAPAPGFARLSQKEAGELRTRIAAFETAPDAGAKALYRAVIDRAIGGALQGAILHDGAGRPVAAATFATVGKDLSVRYLGALETAAPGSGAQMVRELAGLAASKSKGLTLWAGPESETVLAGLGFSPEPGGRLMLSAKSALALAQAPPGSSTAWSRAGWLEGPEATFSAADTSAVSGVPEWGGIRKAVAPEFMPGPDSQLAVLRSAAGQVIALAEYQLPKASTNLVLVRLWVSPSASPATGRRMIRELAGIATRLGRGMVATESATASVGLFARMGMVETETAFTLTPAATASVASGLTGGATVLGEISWELAVAGAAEWLARDVIPGVIDDVNAATYQQLIDTLVDGLNHGEGTNALIARIRALDETTFGLARAERIARSEVITANRAGSHQIAVDAGCTEHRWNSRLMPNTRAWHREAHGQTKPILEPFQVANRKGEIERLLFPGDRSLGAGPDNVIQCACSETTLKPGVSDDAAYDEHGLAGETSGPGVAVAAMPEPIRKRRAHSLEDLREFVAKAKWKSGPNAHWQLAGNQSEPTPVKPVPKPKITVETQPSIRPGGQPRKIYVLADDPASELQVVHDPHEIRTTAMFFLPEGRRGQGLGQALILRALKDGPIATESWSGVSDDYRRVQTTLERKGLIETYEDEWGREMMRLPSKPSKVKNKNKT